MKTSYIECDTCGKRHDIEPPRYIELGFGWIEVSRSVCGCGSKIKAGASHFCSEDCLLKKLGEPK